MNEILTLPEPKPPSMQYIYKRIRKTQKKTILVADSPVLPDAGTALRNLGKVDEEKVAETDHAVAAVADLGGDTLVDGGEVEGVADSVNLLPAEGHAVIACL